ncbi:ferredoxin-thioredoxin reductase, variable chain [Abrus precatorius]|uniref:Ferredoxin-thioredoxin reductase, variable chain n=1 Tax=Abrus precatorius TaxID=3816 RepID=A0A8B8LQ41_ABRPR|nr:ferredoxin-thioredoxin reductase, variable chain [Abrus precatorius]
MRMSSSGTSASALRLRAAMVGSMVSVSRNCSTMMIMTRTMMPSPSSSSSSSSCSTSGAPKRKSVVVRCEVANALEESSLSTSSEKIGARVKVKVPVKVYHIPKVAEFDLTGMEGQIKQYVGVWNGKRISANLPFKVEFVTEIQGRGPVKFFAHLKEDEFDYLHE